MDPEERAAGGDQEPLTVVRQGERWGNPSGTRTPVAPRIEEAFRLAGIELFEELGGRRGLEAGQRRPHIRGHEGASAY
jgi:hypothetical protein